MNFKERKRRNRIVNAIQETGKKGENLAEQFLRKKGYQIIERNFYTKQGEIDIIAKEQKEYVFVEVKTRRNTKYGEPIESVNNRKIRHLKKAIRFYLYLHALENCNMRLDVIEIKIENILIKKSLI